MSQSRIKRIFILCPKTNGDCYTYYFEDYVLEAADYPILLAFNEVNRVFDYPEIARDFLPLLRYSTEQSKQSDLFSSLRMVMVHSTEVYVPLKIHQSSFNIGCPIKLPSFSFELAQAESHGESVKELLALVGGSPYRLSLAFYFAKLESLVADVNGRAIAPDGVYAHIRVC